MKTLLLRTVFSALLVLSFLPSLQAQSSSSEAHNSSNAHLSGQVIDVSGYGMANVRITARPNSADAAPLQPYVTTSTGDGSYSLQLPPGEYRVLFEHSAFVSQEVPVQLTPGASRKLEVRLEIAPLSDNVVVTANAQALEISQTSAPVDVLTRAEIDQRQTVLLPALLETQPGIAITRTGTVGGLTTVFLDGGNSSFTKVLVDGTAINLPGGDVDFSNLTLDNVEKVEIVHGAESALYGTDAMSGVIQIFTHRGTTRVPEANLFAEGGSFASARGGAQVSGALGGFDYSASGSYFHTDGQGVNDADLIRSYTGNVGYSFSESDQIRLSVRSNSSFAGTPGQTLLFPADPSAYYDLQQLSANLSWSFQTGSHWSHRVSATEARYFSNSGFPPFGNALNQTNRAGGWAQSTYSFEQGAFTAGYQYEVENATSSGFGFVHGHRNNQGGFLDGRWSPISRLTLSVGARAEDNTSFGTRVVPRAGAVFGVRSAKGLLGDTRARVSYGQGIEEPTVLESFNTDPCSLGNPNLRPQRSRTVNVGVDQYLADDRVRVSATYFADRFRDLIAFVVVPQPGCPFGDTRILNTDLSRARGVNFGAALRLRHWLALNGSYSHDDTRVLQSSTASTGVQVPGDHLLRRPVNSGNAWLNANYRGFNFNVNAYFTGARTDSDFDGLGLTRNPGYTRFDVASSYNIGRGVSFHARAINLLDKQYQEAIGFPALGRDVRVGVNYRFSGRN
jgi:vitamin B12 transporter